MSQSRQPITQLAFPREWSGKECVGNVRGMSRGGLSVNFLGWGGNFSKGKCSGNVPANSMENAWVKVLRVCWWWFSEGNNFSWETCRGLFMRNLCQQQEVCTGQAHCRPGPASSDGHETLKLETETPASQHWDVQREIYLQRLISPNRNAVGSDVS